LDVLVGLRMLDLDYDQATTRNNTSVHCRESAGQRCWTLMEGLPCNPDGEAGSSKVSPAMASSDVLREPATLPAIPPALPPVLPAALQLPAPLERGLRKWSGSVARPSRWRSSSRCCGSCARSSWTQVWSIVPTSPCDLARTGRELFRRAGGGLDHLPQALGHSRLPASSRCSRS